MYPFRRSCKEVARMVVARQDRAVSWNESLALGLHMKICAACTRFERQFLTMHHAMRHWRNYTEET